MSDEARVQPKRIQRKRTKGWKMPPNTVYVGRPTKWGNPYCVGRDGTARECASLYALLFASPHRNLSAVRAELRGKNLACFCSLDQPCHADVLLEIANG